MPPMLLADGVYKVDGLRALSAAGRHDRVRAAERPAERGHGHERDSLRVGRRRPMFT
jgi:hypothetical protein